jgi:hypothetical protein
MVMSSGGRQISWLFFKARAKRPYLSHTGRASPAAAGRKNSQLAPARKVALKMGWRPSRGRRIGYVSIPICALSASPARTALPTAHFERHGITIISETVH